MICIISNNQSTEIHLTEEGFCALLNTLGANQYHKASSYRNYLHDGHSRLKIVHCPSFHLCTPGQDLSQLCLDCRHLLN